MTEVPWTHRRSKWADDKRWKALLEKVAEMSRDGMHVSSYRGSPMEGEKTVYCMAAFYIKDSDYSEREMYLLSCDESLVVKTEGPWIDSGDQYWPVMAKRDEDVGNALITEAYEHYLIQKDSAKPGQGDGFGGSEFRIQYFGHEWSRLVEWVSHWQIAEMSRDPLIISHNLWGQGTIPPRHRHLFKPNCKIL
jgi:hypothetical protein